MTNKETLKLDRRLIGTKDRNKTWIRQHVAGIIPVAGERTINNINFNDYFTPIDKNLTALERAVVECVHAKCSTIWIILEKQYEPIVKYRLGEYVRTQISEEDNSGKKYHQLSSIVNISYVAIRSYDITRGINSTINSILYGCLVADEVCACVATYNRPTAFYICSPYSINPLEYGYKHKHNTFGGKRSVLISHKGKTVYDDLAISFSINQKILAKLCNYYYEQVITPQTKLKIDKKDLTVSNILKSAEIRRDKFSKYVELDWHYDIRDWENYCNYLSNKEHRNYYSNHPLLGRYIRGKFDIIGDWENTYARKIRSPIIWNKYDEEE